MKKSYSAMWPLTAPSENQKYKKIRNTDIWINSALHCDHWQDRLKTHQKKITKIKIWINHVVHCSLCPLTRASDSENPTPAEYISAAFAGLKYPSYWNFNR